MSLGSVQRPMSSTLPPSRSGNNMLRRMAPLGAVLAALATITASGVALRPNHPPAAPAGLTSRATEPPSSPAVPSVATRLLPLWISGSTLPHIASPLTDRVSMKADLPDGPDAAYVRRLAAADRAAVARLAAALDVPLHRAGASVFTKGTAVLRVEKGAGTRWSFSAPSPLDRCTTCGAPAPLSRTAALEKAAPVLEALGLDARKAAFVAGGTGGTVAVHPTVDGLPTAGLSTTITIGWGEVVAARGWLLATSRGANYPVISAAEAYDVLLATPQPLLDRACPHSAPPTDVPHPGAPDSDFADCGGGPVTIVDAAFGLSLQRYAGRAVLVPSWLFEVRELPHPLVQVALHSSYVMRADAYRRGAPEGSAGPAVAPFRGGTSG